MASARNAQGEELKILWGVKEWGAVVLAFVTAIVSGAVSYTTTRNELGYIREVMREQKPAVDSIPVLTERVNEHGRRLFRLESRDHRNSTPPGG